MAAMMAYRLEFVTTASNCTPISPCSPLLKPSFSPSLKPKSSSSSLICGSSSFARFYATGAMRCAPVDAAMNAVQRRLMFEDECILVDERDNVIGHDTKYNCHLMENIEAGKVLHRAFSVFLFDSNYELLLQQRSATKVTFPLVWTNTCCSHPLYRESELIEEDNLGIKNAAQRKLLDELGITAEDVPVDQFIPLGLDYLLFIIRDVSMNPNPDEVANVKYVNRKELKEICRKADAGEEDVKLSPWFRLVVDNFLYNWWDHVEKGTLKEAAEMGKIYEL